MKKILAAGAAFLLLMCVGTGCRRSDAPAPSTDAAPSAETVAAARSESASETLSEPEAAPFTAPETTAVPETTTAGPTSASTAVSTQSTSSAPSTSAVSSTQPDTSVASAAETTTTAPVAQTTETQPQTTRLSIFEQWRERRNRQRDAKTDPAFFDDAVFVGDSVTQGLRNYTTAQRNKGEDCLGAAQFLSYGSMSYTNVLGSVSGDSMHPTYQGNKVKVEDGIQLCGANKAFIMLGMNDFSAYGESTWKQNICTLLDRIREKNPNVSIYLESVTPILSGMEHGRFTNANIQQFNAYLQQVCSERGYTYVDIYHVLADENGFLKRAYCGDPGAMGIHMSNDGSAAWAQYLQTTFCGS